MCVWSDSTNKYLYPFPIMQVKRVFASLANGTLCVFSCKSVSEGEQVPTGDAELMSAACTIKCEDEQFQEEAHDWEKPFILQMIESNKSSKCMTFVGDKQLWCGCGNTVTVVDRKKLCVLKYIPVFVRRQALVCELVSNGTCVWGVGKQLSCVMEWDVETFTLLHVFNCHKIDPTDQIIISDPKLVDDLIDPDNLKVNPGPVEVPLSPKPEAEDSFNVENKPLIAQTSRTPFSQRSTRTTLRHISRPRGKNIGDHTTDMRQRIASSRDDVLSKHLGSTRTTSLVIVDATLWVGRGMGDVLVVDITGKEQHGKVLARLSTEQCEKYGNRSYNKLVGVAGEYVVSSQWLEPVNSRRKQSHQGKNAPQVTGWQTGRHSDPTTHQAITIWKAWNHEKIAEFMKRRSAMLRLDEDDY